MAFTAQARNRGYAELWTAEIGPASVRILWTDIVKQGYSYTFGGSFIRYSDADDTKKVLDKSGSTIMEYEALPESYKLANEQAGTVEEFFYDTLAYTDDGVARESLRKRALVYLPYGYDASKSYNILYLLHGGGEDESS